MLDYLIIGGGVVGTFIARELSRYDTRTVLIEKEDDLGQLQSTHNSALIHSPLTIPPEKGALKARLAVAGNAMYRSLAPKLGVPLLINGAYMLAFDDEEMEILKTLEKAAASRGIEAVRCLDRKTVLEQEPNLNPAVKGALSMPTAMTADTYVLISRIARNATVNGVKIHTGEAVETIEAKPDHFVVHTTKNIYETAHVINAAGIKNAHIAQMVESNVPYTMRPHRGEYYVLDESWSHLTTHTLFPVPKDYTKGILVIPQPDATIRLGPTSDYQESLDFSTPTFEGLKSVRKGVERLLKDVSFDAAQSTYAGVRSTIDQEDFYIKRSFEYKNFIHVAGIDSPGVTAAPAIAEYVVEECLRLKETHKENPSFDPFKLS